MAAQKGASGYIGTRGETVTLAPGGLGFNKLLTPDDGYQGGAPNFQANVHYNDEQFKVLVPGVQGAIDRLWPKYLEEHAKAPKAPRLGEKPSALEWLEDRLKAPSEKSRNQTPFIRIQVDADYTDRDNQVVRRVMRVWDGRNTPLDLASLGLGMGSIVQPVVSLKLFTSPIVKQPQPSMKLMGFRVLKLERYSGGAPALDTVSDADLEALGNGFEMDDLSAYAGGGSSKEATKAPAGGATWGNRVEADLDDEIPF